MNSCDESIHDVVIVGAGPAGSYAAAKLAAKGLDVLLLEARDRPIRKTCGEYLCPSAAALLAEDGTLDEITAGFPAIIGMKMAAPGCEPVTCRFPKYRKTTHGLAVNREVFDQRLLDFASRCGAKPLTGRRIQSIRRQGNAWCLESSDGERHHASILIGADGRNSRVAKLLGIRGKTNASRVALHCHLSSPAENERLGEMHLFADGSYIGIDPTGDHETNVSLVCDAGILKSSNPAQALNRYLKASPALRSRFGEVTGDCKINAVCPITNRVSKVSGDRFALIGDAAGFLDPLTGEGMYQALWSASVLAEELLASFGPSSVDPNKALRRYARRKRKQFRHKTILNHLLQRIIRRPLAMKLISRYLHAKPARADAFVGIIGNNYQPFEGIRKLITA